MSYPSQESRQRETIAEKIQIKLKLKLAMQTY